MNLLMESGATFSTCRKYRWLLWRIWNRRELPLNLLMLNGSTAGEVDNDPTVERQVRRASLLGFGGLLVTNAFGFCATDPEEMKRQLDPVGPENDRYILQAAKAAVRRLLAGIDLYYLRMNGTGEPAHPLYLPYKVKPVRWNI